MTKSGPPTPLAPSEYEAIERAMMETARGRWFLAQFAEKNRREDTSVVLEAIEKLQSSMSKRSTPEADRIKTDLVEMSKAIERTRSEIANLKLPEQDGGNLLDATEELDAIVSTTERATTQILQAAEDIQETAWTIREEGKFDAPCARIDNDVTDIYTACSFQDITGQRTQKVVHVLRYLEARINAMVSIWGLDELENLSEKSDAQSSETGESRPDSHLLNGPQMEHMALKQHDVDAVIDESYEENLSSEQEGFETELEQTAKHLEQAAHEVEALSIHAVEVAEELSHASDILPDAPEGNIAESSETKAIHEEEISTAVDTEQFAAELASLESTIPAQNTDTTETPGKAPDEYVSGKEETVQDNIQELVDTISNLSQQSLAPETADESQTEAESQGSNDLLTSGSGIEVTQLPMSPQESEAVLEQLESIVDLSAEAAQDAQIDVVSHEEQASDDTENSDILDFKRDDFTRDDNVTEEQAVFAQQYEKISQELSRQSNESDQFEASDVNGENEDAASEALTSVEPETTNELLEDASSLLPEQDNESASQPDELAGSTSPKSDEQERIAESEPLISTEADVKDQEEDSEEESSQVQNNSSEETASDDSTDNKKMYTAPDWVNRNLGRSGDDQDDDSFSSSSSIRQLSNTQKTVMFD